MKDLRNELIASLKSENKALKELVSIYRSQNITIQEPQLKEVEEDKGFKVGDIIKYEFKNGETYDIQLADKNGILVFVDAICEIPFDDKENWRDCTNDYEHSTIKQFLEKWWEENAPDLLKSSYRIDLLESDQVIDSDRTLELFKNWHNRVKGLKGKKYSTWWWTKTASPSFAYCVRHIGEGGSLYSFGAYGSLACVPACVPINESNNPRVPNE